MLPNEAEIPGVGFVQTQSRGRTMAMALLVVIRIFESTFTKLSARTALRIDVYAQKRHAPFCCHFLWAI